MSIAIAVSRIRTTTFTRMNSLMFTITATVIRRNVQPTPH